MKKAKRKRPAPAKKPVVVPRKKKRRSKMSTKKDDEATPPDPNPKRDEAKREEAKRDESRRATGGVPEQTSDPVELAKKDQGDPMGQPPDNPQAPNPAVENDPERDQQDDRSRR